MRIGDLQFLDTLIIVGDNLKKLAESHVTGGYPPRCANEMVSYLPNDVKERFLYSQTFLVLRTYDSFDLFKGRKITIARSFLQLAPAERIITEGMSTRPKHLGDDIVSYIV